MSLSPVLSLPGILSFQEPTSLLITNTHTDWESSPSHFCPELGLEGKRGPLWLIQPRSPVGRLLHRPRKPPRPHFHSCCRPQGHLLPLSLAVPSNPSAEGPARGLTPRSLIWGHCVLWDTQAQRRRWGPACHLCRFPALLTLAQRQISKSITGSDKQTQSRSPIFQAHSLYEGFNWAAPLALRRSQGHRGTPVITTVPAQRLEHF